MIQIDLFQIYALQYHSITVYLFYIILKMRSKIKGIPTKFAFAVSRSILKASIPAPLHFTLLMICFIHTSLSFINPESLTFIVMKWLDPSLYLNPEITLLIVTIPNILTGITIISQIIWAGKQQKIQTSIFKHYLIKISTVSGLVLGYALCLPIIRSSVLNLSSIYIQYKIIAILNLVIFLFVNYLYSMFLFLDLSPHNEQVYACVHFPNCYTILNFYRPIAALIAATNNNNYTIVPAVILLFIMVFWLIKYPLITWRYNHMSQIFICSILWTILCKIISLISQQQVLFMSYLIGLPIFCIFFLWILRKRLVYILKKDQTGVLQLKILYYLLVNFEDSKQQLDIFIIQHYCKCTVNGCSCQKIIEHLSKQKSTNQSIQNKQKMLKSKVMKKTKIKEKQFQYKQSDVQEQLTRTHTKHIQLKQRQKQYWYELLCFLHNQQFVIDKVNQLSMADKETKIKKSSSVICDQIQVLHYFLDKQYQSLRNLWFCSHYLKDNLFPPFFLLIRFTIQLYKQDQTIKKKSKQEGSNQYALNFCDLQTKLLNFRQLILKSTIKIQYFWQQLASTKPDQKKIIQSIQQILKSRQNIQTQLKQYEGFDNDKNSLNQYEKLQKKKIKIVIQNVYRAYQQAINMKLLIKISESQSNKYQKQGKKLEKNLVFYDSQAKTGMGVVNIQQGQQFGLITVTNKHFWELFNYQRFQKPKINHFLVKQMHKHHDRTIVNYLRQNKHFLSFSKGFVFDGNKLLVQLQFSAQLLPHIYNGLFAAAFFQEVKSSRSVFLADKISNILAYNKSFKQKYLGSTNIREFDEIINKEVILKLDNYKKCVVSINDIDYLVKNIHQIIGQDQQQDLYFCEIHQQWDNIPIQSNIIEQQQKSQFYNRKEETRKSKTKKQQIGELKKLKKQNLQYLFSIVRNTKMSSKLKKWTILVFISLIVSIILTILCTGFTQMRVQVYLGANKQFNSDSKLVQHITQSAYTIRRISNLNFNNFSTDVPTYYKKLKHLKEKMLEEKVETNLGLWPILYPSYQITQNDKILLSNTNFQMIIQKYLLAAYTTFINNMNSVNFDYVKSQIVLPYNTLYLNFLGALYNTYYVLLPQIVNEFKKEAVIKSEDKMFKQLIVTYLAFSIVICQLLMVVITLIFRRRLLNTLQRTIKLIEQLKLSFIEQRVKEIKCYTKINLADLWQGERLKQIEKKRQGQDGITQNFSEDDHVYNLRKLTVLSKPDPSVDNLNSTMRDLTQTPRDKDKQIRIATNVKDKGVFKMEKMEKSKILAILIFGILPVIAIQCTVAITQIMYNVYFWDTLTLKRFYNEKSENIRYIKSFSYEIGYETDNFKSKNTSIISQLKNSVEKIYFIQRSIKQIENKNTNSFIQQVQKMNQLNFCQILDSFYENDNSLICNPYYRIKYSRTYRSEVLVQYIETARDLSEEYQYLNLTIDKQKAFAQDPRHRYLEQIGLYLIEIQEGLINRLQIYFTDVVKDYQITLIGLALSALAIVTVGKIMWSKYQLKRMQFEMQQIKLIIQLISQDEINNNAELKQQILDTQDIFDIII